MSKINLILESLVLVHETLHAEEVEKIVLNAVRGYGFPYFGLFRRVYALGDSAPRWQSVLHSLRGRPLGKAGEACAQLTDGSWSKLSIGEEPFYWDSVLEAAKRENNVIYRRLIRKFNWAAEAGITHGITFPVFSREGLIGHLTLGSNAAVELSPVETDLFQTLGAKCLRQIDRLARRDESADDDDTPVLRLSDRELLILQSIAAGMTSVETGKAAGISPYTVDWYITGLQRKLHARNRQNLIALAFRLGLIR